MDLNKYAKAVVGALVAAAAVLEFALVDDYISGVEWVRVASAFLVSLGLVWGVQNAPEDHLLESTVERDSSYGLLPPPPPRTPGSF